MNSRRSFIRKSAFGVAGMAFGGLGLNAKSYRKIYDDHRVDAIIDATPDHWHAPGTINAVSAGKYILILPCRINTMNLYCVLLLYI
jgi:predicted dehydrogenase